MTGGRARRALAAVDAGRITLGVVAGVLTTFLLVMAFTWAASAATGTLEGGPTTAYLALNLLGNLLAALMGGHVAMRLGRSILAVWFLAGVFLGLTIGSLGEPLPGQPSWYAGVIALEAVLGVLTGGYLTARTEPEPVTA